MSKWIAIFILSALTASADLTNWNGVTISSATLFNGASGGFSNKIGATVKSSSAASAIPINIFSNFRGTNNEVVSAPMLTASSVSTYNIGSWGVVQEAGATMIVTGTGGGLLVPASVEGTNVLASTNWIKVDCAYSTNYIGVNFNGGLDAAVDTLSIGLDFYFENFGSFISQDLISVVNDGGGQYSIFNFFGDTIDGHSPNGGTGKTPAFTLSSNTVYHATSRPRANGICEYRIYSSTGTLLWSDTLTNNSTIGFNAVVLGRFDRIPQASTGSFYFRNLEIDFERAVFPLGVSYVATNYPSVPSLTVSDDFAGTGALSANWMQQHGTISRDSDNIYSISSGQDNFYAYTNANFNADQFSSYTLVNADGNFHGVTARTSGTGSYPQSGYGYIASSALAFIGRFDAGSFTSLLSVSPPGWSAGDVIKLKAEGRLITVWQNTTLLAYIFDSNYTSGSPGVWLSPSPECRGDNFAGGNIQ